VSLTNHLHLIKFNTVVAQGACPLQPRFSKMENSVLSIPRHALPVHSINHFISLAGAVWRIRWRVYLVRCIELPLQLTC